MAVSAFNPHAGRRADVVKEIHQMASNHSGCKCGSCGSSEYVTHKGHSICSYCRTPERTQSTPASTTKRRASYESNAADYASIVASLWAA